MVCEWLRRVQIAHHSAWKWSVSRVSPVFYQVVVVMSCYIIVFTEQSLDGQMSVGVSVQCSESLFHQSACSWYAVKKHSSMKSNHSRSSTRLFASVMALFPQRQLPATAGAHHSALVVTPPWHPPRPPRHTPSSQREQQTRRPSSPSRTTGLLFRREQTTSSCSC